MYMLLLIKLAISENGRKGNLSTDRLEKRGGGRRLHAVHGIGGDFTSSDDLHSE